MFSRGVRRRQGPNLTRSSASVTSTHAREGVTVNGMSAAREEGVNRNRWIIGSPLRGGGGTHWASRSASGQPLAGSITTRVNVRGLSIGDPLRGPPEAVAQFMPERGNEDRAHHDRDEQHPERHDERDLQQEQDRNDRQDRKSTRLN